jgi:hypothetical protein
MFMNKIMAVLAIAILAMVVVAVSTGNIMADPMELDHYLVRN